MKSIIKWLILRRGIITEIRAFRNKWPGKPILGKVDIGKDSVIDRYMGGNIKIEDNVTICQHCRIATCGGSLFIGNGVRF